MSKHDPRLFRVVTISETVWDLQNEIDRLQAELKEAEERAESIPDLEERLACARDRLKTLKRLTHYDDGPATDAIAAEA